MASRPKKHRFVVEITDMEMGYSTRRMKQIVYDALDSGLYVNGYDTYFANIQVKEAKRVEIANRLKLASKQSKQS